MKKRIAITYLLCIHLLLVFVLIKSDFISRVEKKLGFAERQQLPPEITEHLHRMLKYHSRIDGNVPDGAVIFIGDSITQGLCVAAIAPLSINYGIGSDTTAGVLLRLSTYQSINRASAVVIAIGVNDLKIRTNEEILRNYASIANHVPDRIPLIFSAILPIDENVHQWKGVNQDRIKPLNAALKALCNKSNRLHFVDATHLLQDPTGNLAPEFHDQDGVHLNSKGNSIWISELREKVKEVCGSTMR